MELSKKTTILLNPELHKCLTKLARKRKVSLGHLVREACEVQYGLSSSDEADRASAVRELAALDLPVETVEVMKAESVPDPEDLS